MKLHPRYTIVSLAKYKISIAISESIKEFDLTYGEILKVISEELSTWITYLIRSERHPDNPDKKGDEE